MKACEKVEKTRGNIVNKLLAFFSAMLMVVMSVVVPVSADEEERAVTERYKHTFDSLRAEDKFSTKHDNFGISYVSGNMQVVSIKGGRAIRVNSCDMRWWMVNYFDDVMAFEFDVYVDENYKNGNMAFIVQNDTPSTEAGGLGGTIVKVKKEGDKTVLVDREDKHLTDLNIDGTVNRIRIETYYGKDVFSVYLNGKLISDTCSFVSPFYSIKGMRFYAQGVKDSWLTLDNIRFTSEGTAYAQPFSYQEPGEIPALVIPEAPVDSGTTFWINNQKIELSAAPVVDGATVYLPLYETVKQLGGNALADETSTIVYNGTVYTLCGNTLSNGKDSITLNHPVREENGVILAPAQVFAEIFDAKVWLDEFHDMVVFTAGAYQSDNILRKLGSYFYMNGQPYYEISFNKYDINWQIAGDAQFNNGKYPDADYPGPKFTIQAAEEALKELHDNGFRTIRVFCNTVNMGKSQEDIDTFFRAADLMYDLCDKYEIQVVACLSLISTDFLAGQYADGIGWVNKGEDFYDFFCKPDSESRQLMYQFIDQYVTRYKDRDTILMWEIANEGNLNADVGFTTKTIGYSIEQLGAFYADAAARIRQNDPERLITGGDSILRSAQWNLYESVKSGKGVSDFTTDTKEERLRALVMLHEGLDVISVHGYGVGYTDQYLDENGKSCHTTWDLFLEEAERLGLGLYNGETGGSLNDRGRNRPITNTSANAPEFRTNYLNVMIESGVQLSHWWTFRADRFTQARHDKEDTSIRTTDETAGSFYAVKAANEAIQAKYVVNPIAAENTVTLAENPTPDADSALTPETVLQTESATESEMAGEQGSDTAKQPAAFPILPIGIAAAVTAVAAGVILAVKKKTKSK